MAWIERKINSKDLEEADGNTVYIRILAMQTADFFGNEGPGSLALIGALCFFQKRHVEEKRPKGPNKGVVVCLSGGRGICTHSLSAGYTMISIQGKPLLHSDCISRHIAAPVSQISGFSCLADYARTNPL